MLFFIVNRIVFVFYNWNKLIISGISEIFATFYQALYLDHSTAMYLLTIPFLIIFVFTIFQKKIILKISDAYFVIIILIVSLITSSELGIYDEWQVKLNYKAISYLSRPSEVANTAKISIIILSLFLFAFQSFIGIYAYFKLVKTRIEKAKRNFIFSILFFLVFGATIAIGIRGGLQPIPINQSDAFFSKNYDINQATVNSSWNFIHSLIKNRRNFDKNPFEFMDSSIAKNSVDSLLYVEKDTTVKFISTKNPNIVFILLESWTADVIEPYINKIPAKNLKKMISEGFYFDNIYATGTLSDQGMTAVLSGFPSMPFVSIIKLPQKYQKLACINSEFKKNGYSSSYYFGGQLSYGNIRAYIYYNNYDKIFEGKDFDSSIPQGRLGVHDEYLFAKNLSDLNSAKQPFTSVMFTLSSHSPFDQPLQNVFKNGGEQDQFLTSVFYTDSCLAEYFKNAKKQTWYKNTLFVLVADHSHPSHLNREQYSSEYRRIPLLFYGDVLNEKFKGTKNHKIFSQIDVTATILAQLEMNNSKFKWSKNMMNPYTKEFAFFSFEDAFGWVKPNGTFIYDVNFKKNRMNSFDKQNEKTEFKNGKAYLQTLFQEYLDY